LRVIGWYDVQSSGTPCDDAVRAGDYDWADSKICWTFEARDEL